METRIINSSNFDQNFKKLLKMKRGKGIASEDYVLNHKT